MIRKGALCVCVIAVLFSASGTGASDESIWGPLEIPDSESKVRVEKRAPLYPTLDSGLNRILDEGDPLETAERLGYRVRDGRVQIVAVAAEGFTDEVMGWLASRDAIHISSARNLVQAFVPVQLLYELEGLPLVKFVRKPNYMVRGPEPDSPPKTKAGSYTTEGVAAMNGNAWHGNGVTGQGVKIAVIDVGFGGYSSLLGSELPGSSQVVTRSFGGTDFEGNTHGSACAEIVYDVAPGLSKIYLASISSGVDALNAFEWARNQGADVITMSMGWGLGGGPSDGTGFFADIINDFVSGGGIVVTSAGNMAQSHWQGRWTDADSDNWLDFGSGVDLNPAVNSARTEWLWMPADWEMSASLSWNQWNSPTTDLDFCLYTWTDETDPTAVACSEDEQSGQADQYPFEYITHTVVDEGYYAVGVKHYSGSTNVDIELEIHDLPVQYVVESGSLSVPSDTASAISVAALDVGTYAIESYSSRGPTNGPGGSLSGGFTKPDISGFANVSTASYGPRSGGSSFNGTSAAAPHVAGAAALVWSANPSWTNAQVRSYLESNAKDKGPSGKDSAYGYGRLHLGDAPSSCSYTLSPTSRTFDSNGGTASFSVSAPSGCGWDATTAQGWIHITGGSSGSGNGTVSYSVDTRTNPSQRSGSIKVGGKSFTITQTGPTSSCSYSISPSSRAYPTSGGTGTINITAGAGCSWTASSSRTWITVTVGSSGSGNGTVSYRVNSNPSSSSRSGTISVGGKAFTVSQSGSGGGSSSGDFTYYAVVAHTTGSNNSVWQSSLSACNVSSSNAAVALTYRYGNGNSVSKNVTIPPYGLAEWKDAPVDLFGVGGKSSGVVTIDSDAPLLVAVRTFNSSVDGTFGQSLPGASTSVSMNSAQYGIISPVRKTSQFRTNIGVINTGSTTCTVEIVFGDSTGFIIGDSITINLAPGEWKQINEALKKAGISRADGAIALLQIRTAGAEVWAYGTVIDNSSGDPTALQIAIFE